MKTNYQVTAGLRQRSTKGFTLIEITLVISLLLGLIAVLFIGITAYKAGSDKAKCQLIQVTCQKAVRSYQNLGSHNIGDAVTEADVVGPGLYAADPGIVCPDGVSVLSYAATIPVEGTAWVTCTGPSHNVANTAGW